MAKNSKRKSSKNRIDCPGGFAGIPRVVMNSADYQNLSGGAVKLLLELAGQFNGKNNGDLTVAYSLLKNRGFNSKSTLTRCTSELIDSGIILRSREGKFTNPNAKCALYALSWAAIDELQGKQLEVKPTTTPPRMFSIKPKILTGPETGLGSVQKRGRERPKDPLGRYSSVQKRGRLMVVT